jgi:hypothetical protein
MTVTRAEAAQLLALAQAYDRRTVGRADVMAWADALQDLHPNECADAIREYFRDSDGWLMPSHVRAIVKAKRADKADRRATDQHHAAIAAVPYEQSAARKAYLEASASVASAIRVKYMRLGEPMPTIPDQPFRRWTRRERRPAHEPFQPVRVQAPAHNHTPGRDGFCTVCEEHVARKDST